MVGVYAVALLVGVVVLIAWVLLRGMGGESPRRWDPEMQFGVGGRRVVAAVTAFGMAGMSAEFSPLGISSWLALVLALSAAAGAAWYAGWVDRDDRQAPAP